MKTKQTKQTTHIATPIAANILFYTTPDSEVQVGVQYANDTFWLPQKAMAELFGVDVRTVNYHLKEIYQTQELLEEATIRNFRIVQTEGNRQVTREIAHYNLDAIIAVGYRVNSKQATQFRIWATQTLREFIIKGFVMDDERLKQGKQFGQDYFDELLERIREIRASERRFYQKITDLFTLASDYDKNAVQTKTFFATVQNKLHYAVHEHTAAELIYTQADSRKPNMGLTTWKHAPDGKILKSDVTIAKNYLSEPQIKSLNRLVSGYLDLAESRAQRQILTSMDDWLTVLDSFLTLSQYPLLDNAGEVSHQMAMQKAQAEFDKFRPIQDASYQSDYDKLGDKLSDKLGDKVGDSIADKLADNTPDIETIDPEAVIQRVKHAKNHE